MDDRRRYFRERHDPTKVPATLSLAEVKGYLESVLEQASLFARAKAGQSFELDLRTDLGLRFDSISFAMWAAGLREEDYFSVLEFVCEWLNPHELRDFEKKVGDVLAHYGDGYKFDDDGNIVSTGKAGLAELLEREPADTATEDDRKKVDQAVLLFRHATATRATKKQALQILWEVLEPLKEQALAKTVPDQEQSQVFEFLNRFKIRHHKSDQIDEYGGEWLDWMFVRALATAHLFWDLKAKDGEE